MALSRLGMGIYYPQAARGGKKHAMETVTFLGLTLS
jgi:hypothetical protein